MFVARGVGVKPKKDSSEGAFLVSVQIKNKSKIDFEIEKPDPKKVVVDFWKVRKVAEQEHSNMKLEMIEQSVTVPTMKEIGTAASSPIVVSVPSAVLTKDVNIGDELVLHVPKAEKPDKKKKPKNPPKAKGTSSAGKIFISSLLLLLALI